VPTLSVLRPLAERLTHHLVVARRLPPPFQATRIYVSSEAGLKYLRPSLAAVDPVLTDLVGEVVRPGHVVWDIGANVGLFAFAAASAATSSGTVVAVEPDTWLVGMLRRSQTRSPRHGGSSATDGRATVKILPAAVGAAPGISTFHIASRNRATSHLDGFGSSQTGGTRAAQLVPTFTLDGLLTHFPAPDVVKIDVEGAEHAVLSGGRRLLGDIRPTVICEVTGRNAEAVGDLLRGHGYRIVDAEVPPPARRPLTAAPWSTLAVPDVPPSTPRPASGQVPEPLVRA
jgi:FkbM family methyltransferase